MVTSPEERDTPPSPPPYTPGYIREPWFDRSQLDEHDERL